VGHHLDLVFLAALEYAAAFFVPGTRMFRVLAIVSLIACMLIQGCASQRTAMVERVEHANERVLSRMTHWPAAEDWLDEHPIVRGTVYCVALGAIVTGVAAVLVLVSYDDS
jgi:hypothetical protein